MDNGKEGFPGTAEEVKAHHTRRVMSEAGGYPGACHDTWIVRLDESVMARGAEEPYSFAKHRLQRED